MLRIESLAILTAAVVATTTEAFSAAPRAGRRMASGTTDAASLMTTTTTALSARPKSKWDLLVDEDDDDDNAAAAAAASDPTASAAASADPSSVFPVANDMTYVERNVKRSHENFLSLRSIGGKEICNDVYAKSPVEGSEEVWYVGKVAKVSDVNLEDSIARQWNLIEVHATNLRPIELFPHRGRLELWTAPGDTELDVAYNRPEFKLAKMERYEVTSKELRSNLIGFQGDVYQDGEEGFRSWRKPDGSPARPEINPGGETRPPTEEEMDRFREEMDRQNISVGDLYDAQEEKKETEGDGSQ